MAKNRDQCFQQLLDAAEHLLKVFWDKESRNSQVSAAWSRLHNAINKAKEPIAEGEPKGEAK